jgi:hypothetical protein
MLQKLGDHIRDCYERAAEAAEQAKNAPTEQTRAALLHMEKTWIHLAGSYEFVRSLEAFLLEAAYKRKRKT